MKQSKLIGAAALALNLGLLFGAQAAFADGATSPEQRAEMIRSIGSLETHPYGSAAEASRSEALRWIIDAPDVSVTLCTALLVDFDKLSKDDEGGILATQLTLSEARFILEHPDQASNDHAVHTAGVEGVLRTYAAMKSEKHDLKLAPMEKLSQIKADGKLAEFVTKSMDRCN